MSSAEGDRDRDDGEDDSPVGGIDRVKTLFSSSENPEGIAVR
jgi:hypothetical protein